MDKSLFSMTGFGSASKQQGSLTVEVEIRCVNHRFLDLNCKLPRLYAPHEADIRAIVSTALQRGRVEIFVGRRSQDAGLLAVHFNKAIFDSVKDVYSNVIGSDVNQLKADIDLHILSRREVLDISEETQAIGSELPVLLEVVREALAQVVVMRRAEGDHLKRDLIERLMGIDAIKEQISGNCKLSPEEFSQRIITRVQRLAPEVSLDPSRLAAEVAILSERVDVSEELVRLSSHSIQFFKALEGGGACGRRLDFIVQEIGRELNTISAKVQDSASQHLVIDAKSALEKIKEQVQNVE